MLATRFYDSGGGILSAYNSRLTCSLLSRSIVGGIPM